MEIEAPENELDRILVERVAPLRAQGPVSFLRANKPTWRVLVERHEPPLSAEDRDAVADSDAAIEIVRLDLAKQLARSRREVVLASIAWSLERARLDDDPRRELHRSGFGWAIELGRWDHAALDALEARFLQDAVGLRRFLEAARDGNADAFGGEAARRILTERWSVPPSGADLRGILDRHGNRLGVFAEPLAILHYFLWRLASGSPGTLPP